MAIDKIVSPLHDFQRPVLYGGAKEIPQAAKDAIKDSLTLIDGILGNSKWMAGDKLTIADFSAVTIGKIFTLLLHQLIMKLIHDVHDK